MNDLNEYIESYFLGQFNDAEKRLFEERCIHDESFAREVAFYITSREAVRQKLLDQKKQQWEANEQGTRQDSRTPVRKLILRKWLPFSVAACLLLVAGLYYFMSYQSPQQLASRYVKEHFTLISQTMDASNDSLQQGIAAYNEKNYPVALQIFEKNYQSHPDNSNALKYAGLVYLQIKNYEKALQRFDELASKQDVYRNPGMFLKAVTLLERNNPGDKANAKSLLEQIVAQKKEGSREAQDWLKKL